MKSKAIYTAMAALSLVIVPMLAAAAPAPVTTPLTQRAGAPVEGDSALAGGGLIIAALALIAVGIGVYIAADSDDSPNSP